MLSDRSLSSARRRSQRGLSLVEMMVGIAVGLIVVAGAAMLVSSQLGENRRLLMETQLQQDMRAAMDIITRELRRMGAQREAVALLGLAADGTAAEENPMARQSVTIAGGPAVDILEFRYQPTQGNEYFGFQRTSAGVVESKLGPTNWQQLTDPLVLNVTALEIRPTHSSLIRLPCPRLCPDGTTNCWPQVMVRDIDVAMTAAARSASGVERTLRNRVRVRNDVVRFNVSSTEICPA